MAKARFNLKNPKDPNEQLIILVFNYNKNRLKLSVEEKVKPKYWNIREQRVRELNDFPQYSEINDKIELYKNTINDSYKEFVTEDIEPDVAQLKERFYEKLYNKKPKKTIPNLYKILDEFIDSNRKRVSASTIKDYNSLKKHLTGYEKYRKQNIRFDSFDYIFYQGFIDYLTFHAEKPNKEKGLAINTVGKQVKNLKIFLRDCFRRKIIPEFNLSDYKSMSEEVDAIYLTEEEISKIYNLDLKDNKEMDKIRDMFIVGCKTGLRFSDFTRIGEGNIHGDYIQLRQQKVNQTVVIPIDKEVKEILAKYNNNLPYVDHMKFNKVLKNLGEIAGINETVITTRKRGNDMIEIKNKKYELIASHTCRRSFCTNQFLNGVPPVLIMKISGHRTEKSFLRYLKIDEQTAAEKMLEYWSNKNN